MMNLLTKSAILAAPDLPHEDVPVPAWGGSVRVRTMDGLARDEFRAAVAAEPGVSVGVGRFSAVLLACTLVDENGDRLFTTDEMEALLVKNAVALDGPAAVAVRLNGLGQADVASAVKNSVSDQSDDSGSGSPKS